MKNAEIEGRAPGAGAWALASAQHCMAQGALADARRFAEEALGIDPDGLAARLIANQAAFIAGDYPAAMHHVEEGRVRHPDCPDFDLRRARCLLVWNEVAKARTALGDAEAKALANETAAVVWGMIGDAHALINDFERAAAAYGRAIALEPSSALHRFNRAVVARFTGDSQAAIRDYEAAVALDPGHAEAWLNLVQMSRQTKAANRIAPLTDLLKRLPATPQTGRQRLYLHFALAKCHEDLGAGHASFVHVDAGARLMRGSLRYDVAADLRIIEMIQRKFPIGPSPTPARGYHGVRPIFVLGMPRSGSTVVERILTSHSDVGTVGESPAFGQALADVARSAGVDPADGEALIRASRRLDPAAIGRRYAELTAPWRGDEPYFVDKLPNNHLHVGLIARALPEARIIHTRRDPLANLYGMYKTLFNRAYPYSYDLDELVAYYGAYRRLMAHWQLLLGPRLIDLSYEALVEDPEPAIRRLIAECGLDWQTACLAFHENPRPSTTQSASQVRSPLNRDGIEGWRRFEHLLTPLRARLERIGAMTP